jgi:hypothetical protein
LLSIPSFLTKFNTPSATVTLIPAAEPAGLTNSSLETYLISWYATLETLNLLPLLTLFLRFQVIFIVEIPALIVNVESKSTINQLVLVGTKVPTVTSLTVNFNEEKSVKFDKEPPLPLNAVNLASTPLSRLTFSLELIFAAYKTTSLVLEETVLFKS